MSGHQADDQRRDILGQLMLEARIVGEMHLGDAGDSCGFVRHGGAALAGDEEVNLAQLRGGGHGVEGRVLDARIVMLDQNQGFHVFSFSEIFSNPFGLSEVEALS